jgi:hypothetical protein
MNHGSASAHSLANRLPRPCFDAAQHALSNPNGRKAGMALSLSKGRASAANAPTRFVWFMNGPADSQTNQSLMKQT